MAIPSEAELTDATYHALRNALDELLATHPGHHFYYCALITSGDGVAPGLAVSSKEGLADAVQNAGRGPDVERELKWSYSDSPFYPVGHNYFDRVRALFDARPQPDFADPVAWERERDLRLRAMERAMARADADGIFGHGAKRDQNRAQRRSHATRRNERCARPQTQSALCDYGLARRSRGAVKDVDASARQLRRAHGRPVPNRTPLKRAIDAMSGPPTTATTRSVTWPALVTPTDRSTCAFLTPSCDEWNPLTNTTRTWHETLDHAGRVRIVCPETGGPKVHDVFDALGNFTGTF